MSQLVDNFISNNITDDQEKIAIAKSRIDCIEGENIKLFIDNCEQISKANTFDEFKNLLGNIMIVSKYDNFIDSFANFKNIKWEKNIPIFAIFTSLSVALDEYNTLLYKQTKVKLDEKVKRALIIS